MKNFTEFLNENERLIKDDDTDVEYYKFDDSKKLYGELMDELTKDFSSYDKHLTCRYIGYRTPKDRGQSDYDKQGKKREIWIDTNIPAFSSGNGKNVLINNYCPIAHTYTLGIIIRTEYDKSIVENFAKERNLIPVFSGNIIHLFPKNYRGHVTGKNYNI